MLHFGLRADLIVMHSIMRSSVPLMKAAYEQCIHSSKEGNLMPRLGKYYKKHIQEEMNHDEWILDDLQSIGIPREKSLSRKPLQTVTHWLEANIIGFITGIPYVYLDISHSWKEIHQQRI